MVFIALLKFWAGYCFVVADCLVCYRMFTTSPASPHQMPLAQYSQAPFWQQKMYPPWPNVSWGAETPLIARHSVNKILYKRESFSTINWSNGNCVTYLHFANLFVWFNRRQLILIYTLSSILSDYLSHLNNLFWISNMKTQPHVSLSLEKFVFSKPSDNFGYSLILYHKSTEAVFWN